MDKLADPSPAFARLLMMENKKEEDEDKMQDSETLLNTEKRKISELFAKVEKARPAVHQRTIELARKLYIA